MRAFERTEQLTETLVSLLRPEFEGDRVPDDLRDRIRDAIAECLRANEADWLSPAQLGAELGVSSERVYHWIGSGQLQAVNFANDRTGKARYRIERRAIEEFKQRRATEGPPPPLRRRRAKPSSDVTQFF